MASPAEIDSTRLDSTGSERKAQRAGRRLGLEGGAGRNKKQREECSVEIPHIAIDEVDSKGCSRPRCQSLAVAAVVTADWLWLGRSDCR